MGPKGSRKGERGEPAPGDHTCAYCSTTETVLWRRGWTEPDEHTLVMLCNPCGLRYKANKMPGRVPPPDPRPRDEKTSDANAAKVKRRRGAPEPASTAGAEPPPASPNSAQRGKRGSPKKTDDTSPPLRLRHAAAAGTRTEHLAQPEPSRRHGHRDQEVTAIDEIQCMVCGRADGEESFVLCDGCPKGGHCHCLKMPAVPPGDWFCRSCRGTRASPRVAGRTGHRLGPQDGVGGDNRKRSNNFELEDGVRPGGRGTRSGAAGAGEGDDDDDDEKEEEEEEVVKDDRQNPFNPHLKRRRKHNVSFPFPGAPSLKLPDIVVAAAGTGRHTSGHDADLLASAAPASPRSRGQHHRSPLSPSRENAAPQGDLTVATTSTNLEASIIPGVGRNIRQTRQQKQRPPKPLKCYSTFYFCRGRVRIRDESGSFSGSSAMQMRVYVVHETTGVTTLAAVGNDKCTGGGRYFTYTTAKPSPFNPEHPTLPAEGATKDACIRWIRDVCPGIRLCNNPPREQHVHVAKLKSGVSVAAARVVAAAAGPRERARGGGGGGGGRGSSGAKELKKRNTKRGSQRISRPPGLVGTIHRGKVSKAKQTAPKFHETSVPVILCTHPTSAASPSGVLRYASYSEEQGTLRDGRRTRRFYLNASKHLGASRSTSVPRLLAVYGEETMKRDKHYRYSVSQEVMNAGMDHVGRPFTSPPVHFKNAAEVQEWLEAVVRKSVEAPPALVRAAAVATHAGGTLANRSVRFAGDGEYDDDDDGDRLGADSEEDDDEEDDEEDDECEALEVSLGPVMYQWCTGAAAPEAVQRLSTMAERIKKGLADSSQSGGGGGGGGRGRHKLTNRDAVGILSELDRRWSKSINMEVLEATQIAHHVATLATPGAGLSPEVAGTAQRTLVRWRGKMERAVTALEQRLLEMREQRRTVGV